MTADQFRSIALSLPETIEASHMAHPDFRVGGKIFATLPKEGQGMVKLTPELQRQFIQADPEVFSPVNGAWGRQGCTYVALRAAETGMLQTAMKAAWRNTAPKRLAQMLEEDTGDE
jgi:hypothetical protein